MIDDHQVKEQVGRKTRGTAKDLFPGKGHN